MKASTPHTLSTVAAAVALLLTGAPALASGSASPADAGVDAAPTPIVDQEHPNLETARQLLNRIDAAGDELSLPEAAQLADIGTRHQADTMGLDTPESVETPEHASLSQAVLALADQRDVELTPAQRDKVDRLDRVDEPVQSAVTGVVDAFIAFDRETQAAYAGADLDGLRALQAEANQDASEVPVDGPATLASETRLDLGPVLTARSQLLGAAAGLATTLDLLAGPASSTTPFTVAPVFALGSATDETYTQDAILSIDVGGSDTYHNNAGGSGVNLLGSFCPLDTDLVDQRMGAAALIDLGAGADEYGVSRSCGANGGGWLGAGFLFDEGGADAYTAASRGTNGGAVVGVGFLFDAAGADTYDATRGGTNGGGTIAGSGLLLDASGDDAFQATIQAANGGGWRAGSGALVDVVGNDTYTADRRGTNGGGSKSGGVGFLFDAGGADTYDASLYGTNGGGGYGGIGSLFDEGGDDIYRADGCGANGAAANPDCAPDLAGTTGVGHLRDEAGHDYYEDPAIPGGSCEDCTIVPKGSWGAQVDNEDG